KDKKNILSLAEKKGLLTKKKYEIISVSRLFKQQLSHQLIAGQFIRIRLKQKPRLTNDYFWLPKNRLTKYAFPGIINQYLQEKTIEQSLF
ncbi:MAG: hypothetical protein ACHQEB_01255, partial [Chitinophagales bacterium]